MSSALAAVRDRRNTPTNVARRSEAHALLDRLFDDFSRSGPVAPSGEFIRVSLEVEFQNGTAQQIRAYSGKRCR